MVTLHLDCGSMAKWDERRQCVPFSPSDLAKRCPTNRKLLLFYRAASRPPPLLHRLDFHSRRPSLFYRALQLRASSLHRQTSSPPAFSRTHHFYRSGVLGPRHHQSFNHQNPTTPPSWSSKSPSPPSPAGSRTRHAAPGLSPLCYAPIFYVDTSENNMLTYSHQLHRRRGTPQYKHVERWDINADNDERSVVSWTLRPTSVTCPLLRMVSWQPARL